MKIRFLSTSLLFAASLTFAACGTQENATDHDHDHDHAHAEGDHDHGHDHAGDEMAKPVEASMASAFDGPRLSEASYSHFGQKVAAAEPNVTAGEMVADPASYSGKPVLMAGTVANVCKSAGCWIMLGDGENQVFVDTKHKFAVPFDCDGQVVVIEGVAGTRENSSGETEPLVVATGIALQKN